VYCITQTVEASGTEFIARLNQDIFSVFYNETRQQRYGWFEVGHILELVLLRNLVEGDPEHGVLVEVVAELDGAGARADVDIVVCPGDGLAHGKAVGVKVERGGVLVDGDIG
jgi:hypothetical protein